MKYIVVYIYIYILSPLTAHPKLQTLNRRYEAVSPQAGSPEPSSGLNDEEIEVKVEIAYFPFPAMVFVTFDDKPVRRNPKPTTINPQLSTLSPHPSNLNSEPQTQHHQR